MIMTRTDNVDYFKVQGALIFTYETTKILQGEACISP